MKRPALTQKQLLFVEHYIQTSGNGTAAARAAGYRGNSATLRTVAYENLTKPYILAEIQRRREAIRNRFDISVQAKREQLWRIAIEAGAPVERSRSVDVETAADGSTVKTIRTKIAPFDPRAAIRAIHELNLMDGDYPGDKVGLRDL